MSYTSYIFIIPYTLKIVNMHLSIKDKSMHIQAHAYFAKETLIWAYVCVYTYSSFEFQNNIQPNAVILTVKVSLVIVVGSDPILDDIQRKYKICTLWYTHWQLL